MEKNKTYSGTSIAEQLLEGTGLGNLLYGKPKTYIDGYGKTRSNAPFKESANGQELKQMIKTAKDAGTVAFETLMDIPADIYAGVKSARNKDIAGVSLAAVSLFLPQAMESGLKGARSLDGKQFLKDVGLTEFDFKRLMERGGTPEQIAEANGRHGLDFNVIRPNTNVKATGISNEMKEIGMTPGMKSRLDYLTEQSKKGIPLVKDKYGNPYTITEWSKLPVKQRGIGKNKIDLQYVDDGYNELL